MKTIFLHFCTVYVLFTIITPGKNVYLNVPELDQILSSPRYSTNGVYNPDIDLTTGTLIRKYGYPSEAHVVTTEDGYLLTLHRIPGKPNSTPVLVQHGLIGSSCDWVLNGPKQALAFLLADQGYDVWLGNYRGNTYARAHVTLSAADSKFWDFSWHEHGIYDLPAMILYITNLKQSRLKYIGYSMGTTGFYVMASLKPDIANRVEVMFSLAPVAYMAHAKSPIRFFAPMARELQLVAHYLHDDTFLPFNDLIRNSLNYVCDYNGVGQSLCANILFNIFGFDRAQLNYTLVPVIFGHFPAGTSTKTLVHYGQEIVSHKFRQFDYGDKENLRIYNSPIPPTYDTSKISVPIALYYGMNDLLANDTDVIRFSKELKNIVEVYRIPYDKFSHLDFLYATQARELLYNRIIEMMGKFGG